jgi:hypothetical protein
VLVCVGASVVGFYSWSVIVFRDEKRPIIVRVLRGTLRIILGLFIVGIFLDGFYAALYWNVWLYGIVQIMIELGKHFFGNG